MISFTVPQHYPLFTDNQFSPVVLIDEDTNSCIQITVLFVVSKIVDDPQSPYPSLTFKMASSIDVIMIEDPPG